MRAELVVSRGPDGHPFSSEGLWFRPVFRMLRAPLLRHGGPADAEAIRTGAGRVVHLVREAGADDGGYRRAPAVAVYSLTKVVAQVCLLRYA